MTESPLPSPARKLNGHPFNVLGFLEGDIIFSFSFSTQNYSLPTSSLTKFTHFFQCSDDYSYPDSKGGGAHTSAASSPRASVC